MKTIRCTDCAAEFTDEELEGKSACPTCGTASVPSSIADDVTIRINWHELRILGIFASNWAERCDEGPAKTARCVRSILKRIHAQHPERAPLTLAEEFAELTTLGDIEVHSGGKVTKLPKKVPS